MRLGEMALSVQSLLFEQPDNGQTSGSTRLLVSPSFPKKPQEARNQCTQQFPLSHNHFSPPHYMYLADSSTPPHKRLTTWMDKSMFLFTTLLCHHFFFCPSRDLLKVILREMHFRVDLRESKESYKGRSRAPKLRGLLSRSCDVSTMRKYLTWSPRIW